MQLVATNLATTSGIILIILHFCLKKDDVPQLKYAKNLHRFCTKKVLILASNMVLLLCFCADAGH